MTTAAADGPVRVFPIGVVGLGAMGLPMARTLAEAGPVLAYDAAPGARDRAAEAGVRVAESLASLARECRTVVLSLPSAEVIEQVVDEILAAAPGRLLLDTSTVGPDDTRRIGALALEVGTTYLDETAWAELIREHLTHTQGRAPDQRRHVDHRSTPSLR